MIKYHQPEDDPRFTLIWWEDGIAHLLGRYRYDEHTPVREWMGWLYRVAGEGGISHAAYSVGLALVDCYRIDTGEARATLPLLTKLAHVRARDSAQRWWQQDIGSEPYTTTEYIAALRELENLGAITIIKAKGANYRHGLGNANRYRLLLDAAEIPVSDEAESQNLS